MSEKSHQFIQEEVLPSLKNILGPIESFKISQEDLEAIKSRAINTGSLSGVSFQNCEELNSSDQKFARRDAKRAYEIQKILMEQDDSSGPDLLSRAELEYVEKEIWSSVIVEAASVARKTNSDHDLAIALRMIKEGMDNLYPRPDYDIAFSALSVATSNFDNSPDVENFFSKYPFAKNIKVEKNISLDSQKEEEIRASLLDIFEEPFTVVKQKVGAINNENLVDTVNLLLQYVGGLRSEDGSGWECVNDSRRTGFAVEPSTKKIMSGRRSVEITWKIFERLMVHEIGVHAIRAERGSQVGFQPLELGMAGYNGAEESLGKLFEDIWTNNTNFSKPERDHYRYISVSYALGVYDGVKHSVDETFKFMSGLRYLDKKLSKKFKNEPEEHLKKSREDVFEHIFRAYRGMPEGVIMTSNLSYFAEKQALVDFINSSDLNGEELVEYLTRGKFNPLDNFHTQVVNKLYEA